MTNYALDLNRFAAFVSAQFGVSDVTRVTPLQVDEFLNHLKERGYRPRSINRNLSAIRQLFNYLVRMRVIGQLDNPAIHVENSRVTRQTPVYLEIDEAATLLLTVREQPAGTEFRQLVRARDFAIFAVFLGTGLRLHELVSLDLDSWQEAVQNQLLPIIGKGAKERFIPLVGETVRAVQRYLALRPADAPTAALFVSRKKRRLSVRQVEHLVAQYCRAAGLKKRITPHKLRHTYASQLVLSGAPLLEIKELLGHEDLNTTKIYTHINPEHLKRVVRRHQVSYLE